MTDFPLFGLSLPFILKRVPQNINVLVLCFLMLAASCKTEYSRISKDPDMQKSWSLHINTTKKKSLKKRWYCSTKCRPLLRDKKSKRKYNSTLPIVITIWAITIWHPTFLNHITKTTQVQKC